jgi:hypothetical protein
MDEFRRQEYKALRATIRERGSVRTITCLVTLLGWAALDLALLVSAGPRFASLLPLIVLVAGFEAIFQLHLGVERVGRYLQVAYEECRQPGPPGSTSATAPVEATPGWETAAMAYGRAYPAAGSDALFSRIFLLATLVNVSPIVGAFVRMRERPAGFVVLVLAHVGFAVRIAVARTRAGRQRGEDLARFREILSGK